MSGAFDDSFTGLRVEHHPPDGPPRVLAETTMWSIALSSARGWVRRLCVQDPRGDVVIVAARTDEILVSYPIPPCQPR